MQRRVSDWIRSQAFSPLSLFSVPDSTPRPPRAVRRGNCWVPAAPDGFTTGNSKMFAAIGVPCIDAEQVYDFYNGPLDRAFIDHVNPSVVNLLIGPNKATVHLQHGLTTFKVQDLLVSYIHRGKKTTETPATMPWRDARRVQGTGIISTRAWNDVARVSTIDFCPAGPDEPVLHRIISTSCNGAEPLDNVVLSIELENRAGSWACTFHEPGTVLVRERRGGATFHVVVASEATHPVSARFFNERPARTGPGTVLGHAGEAGFVSLDVPLGTVVPGSEVTVVVSLVPNAEGDDTPAAPCHVEHAFMLLERTRKAWKTMDRVTVSSGDARLDATVDAMLVMGLCHAGTRGIHAGSVYYSHGRAWTRDNYWVQQAFHHTGCHEIAARNAGFFLDAWEANKERFANSYGIPSMGPSNPDCEVLVELPEYHMLMMTAVRQWAPARFDGLGRDRVARLASSVLDTIEASPGGLFPLNSDETWIWACDVLETGVVLDNSTLTLAALVAMQDWLGDVLAERDVARVQACMDRVEKAMKDAFLVEKRNRLAVARDDDGIHDESAMTIPLSMPFIHDLVDRWPWLLDPARNGLVACWNACRVPVEGGGSIARSHSATTAMTGNAPGHFLEAVSAANAKIAGDEVLDGIVNLVNCTGSVNEVHDMFDPSWGTERRRLWDTMSTLQGIFQHLLGTRVRPGGVLFTPWCPENAGHVSIDELDVRDHRYSFRVKHEAGNVLCAVKRDGMEIARYRGLKTIHVDDTTGAATLQEAIDTTPYFHRKATRHPFWIRVQGINAWPDPVACTIIHDEASIEHAMVVAGQLLFTRQARVPVVPASGWEQIVLGCDVVIWIASDVPPPVRDVLVLGEITGEMRARGYTISTIHAGGREVMACWIPNNGHVYKDTNRFIQDTRLRLVPARMKPMSAHPHGILRFSDGFGSPVDDEIALSIEVDAASAPPGMVMPLFVHGVEQHVFTPGTGSWTGSLRPVTTSKGITRTPAFLLVSCITPFAPFDLAAAGIANGRHAAKLVIQGDALVPVTVTITLDLPSSWHPQNLRSPRWERLGDPARYHRLASGRKRVEVTIHPGKQVNAHHGGEKEIITSRHLTFVFVKYP